MLDWTDWRWSGLVVVSSAARNSSIRFRHVVIAAWPLSIAARHENRSKQGRRDIRFGCRSTS